MTGGAQTHTYSCLCTDVSRKLNLHVNSILLVYGGIISHCSLVRRLYSNQSTTHCLHQQPEDYCRRRLSQYSLLRLKSYFSASTGYSVPKATICASWQMSQSLHHLGVAGPPGATLPLCKSEHSSPLSQATEDK